MRSSLRTRHGEALLRLADVAAKQMGILGLPDFRLLAARDCILGILSNYQDRLRAGEWRQYVKSFYTDTILCSPFAACLDDVRDVTLLEPFTRDAVTKIIAASAARGIRLSVTETYRSKERQADLFKHHATHLQDVGVHHFGLAVDFCKIVAGQASWEGDWTFLGELARSNGLIWGGDWGQPDKQHGFRDMDHVQRVAVKDQPRLFAGEWYPDEEYDPYREPA